MIAKLDENGILIFPNYSRMVTNGRLIINGTDEVFKRYGFVDVVESNPADKEGYIATPTYKYNKDKTLILQEWSYTKEENNEEIGEENNE